MSLKDMINGFSIIFIYIFMFALVKSQIIDNPLEKALKGKNYRYK